MDGAPPLLTAVPHACPQEPPIASRAVRGLCLLALLGAAAWFAQIGGLHVQLHDPDFEYFYKGGAWLLERGQLDPGYDVVDGRVERRGMLDWYWPCVPRLMSLFALLPYEAAGFTWLGLNLVALLATLRLVGRHLTGLPPQDWPVTQLVPFVLLLFYWRWEFFLNQINTLTLLLMTGSFVCWQRRQRWVSGFWLGLAVLLKVSPGLLVLWFVLKREYRTVAAAVATVALAGPVADLPALGPEQTAAAYRTWLDKAVTTGSHRGLILAQRETDWRNQGLGVVLSRWLHPTNYSTRFDNDPRLAQADEPQTMNVVNLPLVSVANIATAVAAVSLLGLLWLARRPARCLSAWQLRFEWALFLLALLWLMPVMRRYHMIWALPAISLVCAGIHYRGWTNRWTAGALAALAGVALAEVGLIWRGVEARGVIVGSVLVLALPLIAMLMRLARGGALAEPLFAPPHPAIRAGVP